MCRSRLIALYCVSTSILRMPLLRQFESVKSMMRYRPPNGTAGLARSRVSGSSREPLPPANTTAKTLFMLSLRRLRLFAAHVLPLAIPSRHVASYRLIKTS